MVVLFDCLTGGPLDQGDIEDLGKGKYLITCPLHYYSFDLTSGVSTTGLKVIYLPYLVLIHTQPHSVFIDTNH